MNLDRNFQIYLPNGNPFGVRLLEWESLGMVGLAEIPRAYFTDFLALPQAQKSGIYYLLSATEIYIGQTSELKTRLQEHEKQKDFWQIALAFFSLKDNFEANELLYLEKLSIQAAQKIARYHLTNRTDGNNAFTSTKTEQKCRHIFSEMQFLLNVAKHDILTEKTFRLPEKQIQVNENSDKILFYCKRNNSHAVGYKMPDSNEFVLLAGSLLAKKYSEKTFPQSLQKRRQEWLANAILEDYDEHHFRLTQDKVMSSPSLAADIVIGNRVNGWVEWKNENGETLDQIYRQK